MTLKAIKNQVLYKNKFKNKITIRYEDFTTNLRQSLRQIESSFDIKANYDNAELVLSKPSRGPKSSHEIKEITDENALDMIHQAAVLWQY